MASIAPATPADKLPDLLARHDFRGLKQLLPSLAAPDLAHLLAPRPVAELLIVFRLLPLAQATRVFKYLATLAQKQLLGQLAPEQLPAMLNYMALTTRRASSSAWPQAAARDVGATRLLVR